MKKSGFIWLLCALFWSRAASAYGVEQQFSLQQLERFAPLVLKVTALDSTRVETPTEEQNFSYSQTKTEFQIVSVLKGSFAAKTVTPLYFAENGKGAFSSHQPRLYRFKAGQSYLLWFSLSRHSRNEDPVLRELLEAMPCRDATPREGAVKAVVWDELQSLLNSPHSDETAAAVGYLNRWSRARAGATPDFDRAQVWSLLQPLLGRYHPERGLISPEILLAIARIAQPGEANLPLRELRELAILGEGALLREAALLALGQTKTHDAQWSFEWVLDEKKSRWSRRQSPEERAAALLGLSNFPSERSRKFWRSAVQKGEWREREAVARAIGQARDVSSLPMLRGLLHDEDDEVKLAAGNALLQFPIEAARPILQKERKNLDFAPIFTIALAKAEPARYQESLISSLLQKQLPKIRGFGYWPVAPVSWAQGWLLLMEFVEKQPASAFQNGANERLLRALEYDANTSAINPARLYKWLRLNGFEKRAQEIRARRVKELGYAAYFFEAADQEIQAGR